MLAVTPPNPRTFFQYHPQGAYARLMVRPVAEGCLARAAAGAPKVLSGRCVHFYRSSIPDEYRAERTFLMFCHTVGR